MKIVIDARIIYTTTGRYVERLLDYLQEIDHENEYVVLLWPKDFDRWQPKAPNFTKEVADYAPFTLQEQLKFTWQLYQLKADLVHFTAQHLPALYLRPHVTTVHDLTQALFVNRRKINPWIDFYKYTVKPLVFKVVIWWFVHGSKYVIVPTDYVRKQVVQRLHRSPEHVIRTYEAGEISIAQAEPYQPLEGKEYILFVGNAAPYKNLGGLIEAFKKINRPTLNLVIVGKKDYFHNQLEAQVKAEGLERIIFTDFVSNENLAWLYQNAACYVFPSLSEGFGLPGLEAMYYDLPVASSNATCLPEVYGDAAHYFDPNDPADMAKAISDILDQPELCKHLIEAGHERIKLYSWRRMAEETLEVYKKALR
jgi:glycosyltransferase involved in cell wall biosynthesis